MSSAAITAGLSTAFEAEFDYVNRFAESAAVNADFDLAECNCSDNSSCLSTVLINVLLSCGEKNALDSALEVPIKEL